VSREIPKPEGVVRIQLSFPIPAYASAPKAIQTETNDDKAHAYIPTTTDICRVLMSVLHSFSGYAVA
jgi:hypothetical protein